MIEGFFTSNPLWADLREIAPADLHLQHEPFRLQALKVAAAVRGKTPEDMASEDLKQHRKTLTLACSIAVTMIAAFIGLAEQFVDVREQRWRAGQNAQHAVLVSHRERRQAKIARTNAQLAEDRRKEAELRRDQARNQANASAAYIWADRDPTLAM